MPPTSDSQRVLDPAARPKDKRSSSPDATKKTVKGKSTTVDVGSDSKKKALTTGSGSKKAVGSGSKKALGSGERTPSSGKKKALGSSSKKPAHELALREDPEDDPRLELERERLELEREKLRLERDQLNAARRALENRTPELQPAATERPVIVLGRDPRPFPSAPGPGLVGWLVRAGAVLFLVLLLALLGWKFLKGSSPIDDKVNDAAERVTAAVDAASKARPALAGPDEADAHRAESKTKREIALALAAKAEAAGDIRAAEDALDVAAANGAPASEIESARQRVHARVRDGADVTAAIALAEKLAAEGNPTGALAAAHGAEAAAVRLNRTDELDKLIARLEIARKSAEGVARANEVLAQFKAAVDRGDLAAAAQFLSSAEALAPPNTLDVSIARARLDRFKATPQGTVYLESNGEAGVGIYARRTAVTNRELKDWIDTLPPGKRRAGPWLAGTYSPEEADLPVKNVKTEDATAFAQARGERLPTAAERTLLAKTFGCPIEESAPNPRGVFPVGFRTVGGTASDAPAAVSDEASAEPTADAPAVAAAAKKKGPNLKALETAISTRVKSWLLARKDLKCPACNGSAKVKCGKCGGSGKINRVSFGGDAGSDEIRCPSCEGVKNGWGNGLQACPNCRDGFSGSRMEQVKLKFGGGAYPAVEYADRSVVVTVAQDGKSAKVTCDVRYACADKFCTENSEWSLDTAGKWQNTSVYQPYFDVRLAPGGHWYWYWPPSAPPSAPPVVGQPPAFNPH